MALDPKSVVRIVTGLHMDPNIIPVGIIYHVSGSPNATSLFNWFNGPSGGVESHFHVDFLGRREQYRDTEREADANYRGNSWIGADGRRYGYISVETQGGADGKWNDAQLASLIELSHWLHSVHPTIRWEIAPGVQAGGLGWHVMFGAGAGTFSWSNARGKVCPGSERIEQCKSYLFPTLLGQLTPVPSPVPTPAPGPRLLGKGAKGEDVRRIQARLIELGYALPRYGADGHFGDETEDAVKDLQRTAGLRVDGIVGPKTLAALDRGVMNEPDRPQIAVDGLLGPNTISLWQQIMGTPIDGVISNPSDLVRAVQRHLNAYGMRGYNGRALTVDGKGLWQDGRKSNTNAALQRYMGTGVDGILFRPSPAIKELQRRLNEGRF